MNLTIHQYIAEAKTHLYCNTSEEDRMLYCTFDFTEKQIDDNVEYFKDCLKECLSPYKSLLYFGDYIRSKNN